MPNVPRRNPNPRNTAPLASQRTPILRLPNVVETPDLGPLDRSVNRMIEQEQQRADTVVLLDADNRLARLESSLRTKASSRKGKDALGVAAEIDPAWQTGIGEIEQGLTNTRQQQAFRNRASLRYTDLQGALERHAQQELERYEDETTKAAVDLRINDALANYMSPDAVAKAGVEARAIIQTQAKHNGWSDEVRDQRVLETLSRIHSGVIARMLDTGDDRAAAAWYQKAKDQITGVDQAKIDHALEEGSTLGEAQRRADAIIATPEITRTAAFEAARAIDDAKLRKAVEQQLDTEFARRDRAALEDKRALLTAASEHIEQGRRPPVSIWSRMTQSDKVAADRRIAQVVRGEHVATDWETYYAIRRQAANPATRADFLNRDLRLVRDKLGNSEYEELIKLQTGQGLNNAVVRGFLSDAQIIDRTLDDAGLFPNARLSTAKGNDDRQRKAEFERAIDLAIQQEKQRTGKPVLAAADVQSIVDTEVLRLKFTAGDVGDEDDQGRRFVPTDQIPKPDRNAIADYLRRNGLTITTSKLERMFAARLMKNRQLFDQIAGEP